MKTLSTLTLTIIFFLSGLSAKDDRLVLVGASYGKIILAITDAGGNLLSEEKDP